MSQMTPCCSIQCYVSVLITLAVFDTTDRAPLLESQPLFQPLSGSVPFQFLLGFFIPPIPGMSTFRSVLGCAHFCLPPSPLPTFLSRWALLPLNVPFVVSAGHIKFLSQVPLSLWGAAPLLNHLLTLSFDIGTSTQKLLVSCDSYPLLVCYRVSCQARNQDS